MWYERTERLLGPEVVERLKNAGVVLFGVGGVGSYAAEALTRAGIGRLTFVDGDTVQESNLNRQLAALRSNLGRNKAEVMAERARDINPEAEITAVPQFYTADNADMIDFSQYDYAADAIDMVTSKLIIARRCYEQGTPLISSCGTGNKLDPTLFEVRDIFDTDTDPLARVMRRELRRLGIERYTVVYSPEKPRAAEGGLIGTVSFVPGSAGLVLAGKIIRDIAGV